MICFGLVVGQGGFGKLWLLSRQRHLRGRVEQHPALLGAPGEEHPQRLSGSTGWTRQRHPVGFAQQRDVALVGLEDGQGDFGRLGHAPQPGPGHELGQVEGAVDTVAWAWLCMAMPLQPVAGDAAEAGRVGRVARDREALSAADVGWDRRGLIGPPRRGRVGSRLSHVEWPDPTDRVVGDGSALGERVFRSISATRPIPPIVPVLTGAV